MKNALGQFSKSTVQYWTKAAIDCYNSKFNCLFCRYYYAIESQPCQMKAAVLELFKKYGEPKKGV